ncbi:MAG: LacI family DNA-binding transcriptional regulator, partial [Rhodobacter sp.]
MRPTVNDIAREAGVSLATVDRVLNDRPGVRAKTAEAVQAAIRRIGYVRDVAAANLARQRDYRLAFVLPDTDSQ